MLIDKLTLVNFGPFYRRHEIDLSVASDAPVVVIHGENMRGKTCLLNSIRWALYDEALGPTGERKATPRLMSYDALDAGETFMTVTLNFSHQGHQYEIERHVQSLIPEGRPRWDSDLQQQVSLQRDGHFVAERDIAEEIGTILHSDVSRFFLFDGEMLAQYEVLVTEPTRSTHIVKQAIERILGLPALRQAARDIDALHSSAERRQMLALRHQTKHAKLVAQVEELQNELDSIEGDLERMIELRSKFEDERETLSERRARFAEIQGDVQRSEDLMGEIDEAKRECASLRDEIRESLSSAWWEPVSARAAQIASQLEEMIGNARETEREAAALRQSITQMQALIERDTCPVCRQPVGGEIRKGAEGTLGELQQQLNEIEGSSIDVSAERARLSEIRAFTSSSRLVAVREKERTLRRQQLEIRRRRGSLEEVNERLRGYDRAEVREIQGRYDQVVGELHQLQRSIEDRERTQETKRSALLRITQQMIRLPEADRRIATESKIYDTLASVFEDAINDFREQLKLEVEEKGTDIFRQLTTESAYARLRINERYGLEIVDEDERVITERSAGAEQVVALSLIGALNRSAVQEGPVVMDTPFGRLDVGHRANILQFVPSMSSQVILLVQSGEMDIERDLVHLEGKIGRQYRLMRDGGPTRSRIERIH